MKTPLGTIYKVYFDRKSHIYHLRRYGDEEMEALCGARFNIVSEKTRTESKYRNDGPAMWSAERCCRSCQRMRMVVELGE